jgi:hypothetical protein
VEEGSDQLQPSLIIMTSYRLDAERKLTSDELAALAKRMTDTSDPAEAALVSEAIVRGFYGGERNAVSVP